VHKARISKFRAPPSSVHPTLTLSLYELINHVSSLDMPGGMALIANMAADGATIDGVRERRPRTRHHPQ
jgi:hypothetical protein